MGVLAWARVVVLAVGLAAGVSSVVLAYAAIPAAAESPASERHARLEVRVDRLEMDVRSIGELQLDRRLTRLETLAESSRTVLLLIGAAVAAQIVERAFRILGDRKANTKGG